MFQSLHINTFIFVWNLLTLISFAQGKPKNVESPEKRFRFNLEKVIVTVPMQ